VDIHVQIAIQIEDVQLQRAEDDEEPVEQRHAEQDRVEQRRQAQDNLEELLHESMMLRMRKRGHNASDTTLFAVRLTTHNCSRAERA
jgi:hypothetical protein